MLKIVLDTNMFISGFLFHGMVKIVFDFVLEDKLQMYISQKLATEVMQKLKAFNVAEQEEKEMLIFLERRGVLIDPKIKITACRDPEDNFVLELVETTNVDYLITRDKDLLELPDQKWKSTQIVKPEAFLSVLRKKNIL